MTALVCENWFFHNVFETAVSFRSKIKSCHQRGY